MDFSAFDETLKDRIRGPFWGGAVGDVLPDWSTRYPSRF